MRIPTSSNVSLLAAPALALAAWCAVTVGSLVTLSTLPVAPSRPTEVRVLEREQRLPACALASDPSRRCQSPKT